MYQIITLYTLNILPFCQLYLSKAVGEKFEKESGMQKWRFGDVITGYNNESMILSYMLHAIWLLKSLIHNYKCYQNILLRSKDFCYWEKYLLDQSSDN